MGREVTVWGSRMSTNRVNIKLIAKDAKKGWFPNTNYVILPPL